MKQQIVSAKLPTLEEAKELVNFINRPINNHVVLIGIVAPKVNTSGVIVGDKFQSEAQQEANRNGMMVVYAPDAQNTKIQDGEIVLFRPETPSVLSRVVTSKQLHDGLDLDPLTIPTPEMYKRYVVLVINASDLTLVLNNKI